MRETGLRSRELFCIDKRKNVISVVSTHRKDVS